MIGSKQLYAYRINQRDGPIIQRGDQLNHNDFYHRVHEVIENYVHVKINECHLGEFKQQKNPAVRPDFILI